MNTMTISPIQQVRHNYVTKGEFNKKFEEQKEYMDTGFNKLGEQIDTVESNLENKIDNVEHRIKELKVLTLEGFEKMEEYIDNNYKEITHNITSHIDNVKIDIIKQIKSSKI